MAEEQNKNTDQQSEGIKNTDNTQAEFEKGFSKGFAKASEKATAKILEELGVSNIDELKAMQARQKEIEDASKTELERAKAEADALKEEMARFAKEKSEAEAKATVNAMAAKHGIKDVDYLSFALKNAGGEFDEETFINDLKENKPYLFGQPSRPRTDFSPNNGNPPSTVKDKVKGMTMEELRKFQNSL